MTSADESMKEATAKRQTHVESEKKRRQNIKLAFDSLIQQVPTLEKGQKSEVVILQDSIAYLEQLKSEQAQLKREIATYLSSIGE
jgi:hypothetical protein